jgi:hypothetical protein
MTQTFYDGSPIPEDDSDYGLPPDELERRIGSGVVPADEFRAAIDSGDNIYRVLNRIATALEKLAENPSRPPSNAPGVPQPPSAQGTPPQNVGPPPKAGGSGPDPVKMGKKCFAICKSQGWDLQQVGEQITGHPMGPNSQKWAFEDLRKVLDQFTEWGV